MRKPNAQIPDQEAKARATPATPTPGGIAESFLNAYAPPVEPFRIILPGGEVFLFKAFQNDAEWTAAYAEAKKVAERLHVERLPVEWVKVASDDPTRNALAIVCSIAMVGWHVGHKREDDGSATLIGEMQPKLLHVQWLRFAHKSAGLFDSVQEKVDKGQISAKNLYERDYIEREKKD